MSKWEVVIGRSNDWGRVNLREIAKRAKVSTATVSRAINHIPSVDPHLAKRVWKAVQELSYYPNTQARALVSGHSRIFGLIVSGITNPFFPEIVDAFEEIAVRHDYEILLSSSLQGSSMERAVRRMIERRVEGVAILTFGLGHSLVEDFRHRNIPVVIVDHNPQMSGVSTIRVDYQHGIRQAVQHLAALRHVRIAFITGPERLRSAADRRNAFETSMGEIGLEVGCKFIIEGDHTAEGGIKAMAQLAALPSPPTAVLCSNDMTAIGVLQRAFELGLSVPKQLSVIGFDDIRLAQFTIPPLTTVQMSRADLAALAFNQLFQIANGESTPPNKSSPLTTNLVLRNSTTLSA
jgi:LacI family transcriptional regulator, galactose operon repressor